MHHIYMFTYKFSKKVDEEFVSAFPNLKEFCVSQNVVYFEPSEENRARLESWLEVNIPPEMECAGDVVCWWRSHGPWGMYHREDNSISICPFDIEKTQGGLKGTILHELAHLEHPEADSMSHDKKEDYIDNLD